MPRYKNHFASNEFIEEKILNDTNETLGTIRIKPVSISWKLKGRGKFFNVSLEDFISWITDPDTKAKRVSS